MMSPLVSNIMFFIGLAIPTVFLGFGCLIIYLAEREEDNKKKNRRKVQKKETSHKTG